MHVVSTQVLGAMLSILVAVAASAQTLNAPHSIKGSYLTGDWGGSRSGLKDKGLVLELSYTSFYQGLVSGTGEEDFDYGGKVDARIEFDTGMAGLWEGGRFRSHIEYSHGELATNLGGTLFSTNPNISFSFI